MQRLARLILKLVNKGHLPPKPNLIIPDFVEG